MKLSDYIADFLVNHGIDSVFTVVGGGAMHLNDSFGHNDGLHCTYHHHEQAAAIAAEGYAKLKCKPAVVCVTSGPGATNAITGVAGAWVDSIPMIVISGQTKSTLTIESSGLPLRCLGNQEIDIVPVVKPITKNAVMIHKPEEIRRELEKALYLSVNGRPGPVWIDIPLDIQGSKIDPDTLEGYMPTEQPDYAPKQADIDVIVEKLKTAKRPVIYAGNGIRIADAYPEFSQLVEVLQIPVVTAWNSIDLMATEDSCYAGRGGTMGDRAGNFAVQNSDFLLSLACRLNLYQSGYDVKTWARAAYTVVVDIDPYELKKPTIRVDKPICCDVKQLMVRLIESWQKQGATTECEAWKKQCQIWKKKYPVAQSKHYKAEKANVYAFVDTLSRHLPEGEVTVVANGSASVVGSQTWFVKKGSRFLMNDDLSSMGYELPAAIGACVANDKKEIVCLAGDGSIQMNLQELQTILTNHLPVKIFLINNDGYQQIRLTQTRMFQAHFVGLGPDSGDLGFPDMEKLAAAYGYPYIRCTKNNELAAAVDAAMAQSGAVICEVFVDKEQAYEPKSSAKLLPDGKIVSPPLEDLAPFLPHEELIANMYIDLPE